MAGADNTDWEPCVNGQCIGVQIEGTNLCLAHADDEALTAELKKVKEKGELDARGVPVDATLLERILANAPRNNEDSQRPCLHVAQFDSAKFEDELSFANVAFGDDVSFADANFGKQTIFDNAQFGSRAWFGGAKFDDGARFDHVTFADDLSFAGATFGSGVWFADAMFSNRAGFAGATFEDEARFAGATFADDASFSAVTFGDWAQFDKANFGNGAWFGGATFGDSASFSRVVFKDEATFADVTFGDEASFASANFGNWTSLSLLVHGGITFRQAIFSNAPDIEISARRVDCTKAKFPDGASLRLRWAEVFLDSADFSRPSILSGVSILAGFPAEADSAVARTGRLGHPAERPRLLSTRGCDLQHLVLADVDLRACRFAGTQNLEKLRLEGTIDFPDRPSGWHAGPAMPPVWRWTRRQTMAEEHRWRRMQSKWNDWYPRESRALALRQFERLDPAEIAALYRAFRKAREDSKDEPGAADFYYGEMEMRRHDVNTPWPERLVIALYWLVSGYALRASRALAWLATVLAIATILIANVGFPKATPRTTTFVGTIGGPRPQAVRLESSTMPKVSSSSALSTRLGTAVWIALEGAVFRTSDQQLTDDGKRIQIVLRFLGPVLLGLALLSIRGRVKR